ncbi:NAD(P)H-dependent glycerol-3-phosphate dehydrogenase [Flammeovirga kamogawensis]|uniref:NAD(P)H-dependent glycerol-3-phosphate dehydrogenase n=1 Tax=Flammeovirga kamogawensis TaxID=373891 RepID=UPI001794C7C9|nr:NAD(P)H-dependent glycerol-3-phosphate dehydrogenase [Flammeovirga kamogawensis]MBB6460971.1 glycerol-3-phosphate dehydrogenase (NAD(P)+) [Flammeovirga kamogawensis]
MTKDTENTQSLDNQEELPNISKIAVIGGGSWATALVKILSDGGSSTLHWWIRNQSDIDHIKQYHSNPRYLPSAKISTDKVIPFNNIKDAIKGANCILLAVPAAFVLDAIKDLTPEDFKDKYVISAIKGLIPDQHILVTEHIERNFGVHHKKVAVIGGPCHAEEVAMEKQAYLTIASGSKRFGTALADAMSNRYIKTTSIRDIYGVEYSAVMKNIVAISCGIAHGLGYGDNFQAVLVSNAMQEVQYFLKAAYHIKRNLLGTAYLGDMLVTSYSQFSRNRTFGNMIGHGYSVKAAQLEMQMVAEGYYAVKSIFEIAKRLNIENDLPITRAVYNILYERISPIIEFRILKEQLN